ncbi:TetR/AcrR family transcriptional regulator C-terminal domain-containing protein [Amycolatopsis rhabdoformis]|uniref:TetR/AcrR family transcriptional regulator C-terminal domain-containing protein n=1 Tax=Amycolatopsis rhabdoformis TaxID=1448059 RepID=A0ABZ1HZ67_9PSEU|nr:TetR/AcrR family transcriptional regulator C-terminal domain-containing protein [Amycolatopsis rhabdoformis]WSE26689.1 TetR/AcrR family transcriptional regulator C-terminal domain-containing protein [Amycolatopsis rhabdoformis]
MVEQRYLEIVAELRRRIADGELVPGAKVPSTRRIATEWGVAPATAAKALAALGQDGLVRAEPRSGTVVAGRRADTRARPRPPGLSRDRIVRTAITIADEEGLAALSMRGVAARLGVAAMAPYRYVAGREELVVLMADAAFGERGYPVRPAGDWRVRLELVARTLWSLYRRHPWLAQLSPITRPLPLANLATHAEQALAALDGFGLPAARLCDLHVLFFSYIQGVAIHLERERHAAGASGLTEEEWLTTQEPGHAAIMAGGRHPLFTRMLTTLGEEGYDLDLDELFELGLRSLLDGVALRYAD